MTLAIVPLSQVDRTKSWFLSTPYTKYERGTEAAYQDACRLAGALLRLGFNIYSPIAHSHGIAIHAVIDPIDAVFWMNADKWQRDQCNGLLVGKFDGWKQSLGVFEEIEIFKKAGKPVYYMDPTTLEVET